jgi:hypothetical protein
MLSRSPPRAGEGWWRRRESNSKTALILKKFLILNARYKRKKRQIPTTEVRDRYTRF